MHSPYEHSVHIRTRNGKISILKILTYIHHQMCFFFTKDNIVFSHNINKFILQNSSKSVIIITNVGGRKGMKVPTCRDAKH